MRVTVICDVLGEANNGTTLAALNLIRYLREKGHTVTVVATGKQNDTTQKWRLPRKSGQADP